MAGCVKREGYIVVNGDVHYTTLTQSVSPGFWWAPFSLTDAPIRESEVYDTERAAITAALISVNNVKCAMDHKYAALCERMYEIEATA